MPQSERSEPVNQESRGSAVIVGIPAYNEERYISSVVLVARLYADSVIVIDDGSTDRTVELAQLAGATVVRHDENKGYGATIQQLFIEAARLAPDVFVTLDGDGQHDAHDIPKLVDMIRDGADVVIGTRIQQKHRIPLYRRAGQNVLARMTNLASRTKLTDTESGFRAYSLKALKSLKLTQRSMAVSAEIINKSSAMNLAIAEVPISVSYAGDGSTLNPVSHGLGVLRQIIVMMTERRPLLFFGTTGLVTLALSIIFGVIVVLSVHVSVNRTIGYAILTTAFFIITVLLFSTGFILDSLARRNARKQ